jgi:hypothetical protein
MSALERAANVRRDICTNDDPIGANSGRTYGRILLVPRTNRWLFRLPKSFSVIRWRNQAGLDRPTTTPPGVSATSTPIVDVNVDERVGPRALRNKKAEYYSLPDAVQDETSRSTRRSRGAQHPRRSARRLPARPHPALFALAGDRGVPASFTTALR